MAGTDPPEIALCAAWHAGAFPTQLTTLGGESVEIIHRGTWTHGLGPDFRDAMVLFAGRELRAGGIEIHLRTRGWIDHGHDRDPAYDAVILHLVLHHDAIEPRRADGQLVPTARLEIANDADLPELASWDWARVGGVSCAEGLTRTNPALVRDILFQLGDRRLAARSARLEARFSDHPPAEVLWQELLDGFGYSANREPMRALAAVVTLAALEPLLLAIPARHRGDVGRGVLLGAAGFLPLSPGEAHLARLDPVDVTRLEAAWAEHGEPWRQSTLPPGAWNPVRVRPANHPVARLVAAANLVATASAVGGLLTTLLNPPATQDDPAPRLRDLTAAAGHLAIGKDRTLDIVASAIIPFALALASHTGDDRLGESAARWWNDLAAPAPNVVVRRATTQVAGGARLPKIGARGTQGLLHLDTTLCQPRRCFECPVAAAALSEHQ